MMIVQPARFSTVPDASTITYTASSAASPFAGTAATYANFTDGSASTGFGSAGGVGDTVTIDWGTAVSVAVLKVQNGAITGWGTPSNYAQTIQLDYWDGGSWVSFGSYAQASLSAGFNTMSITPVATTTKIRFVGLSNWFGICGLAFV